MEAERNWEVEHRLEKLERLLKVGDEAAKLRSEQDEIKSKEVTRRIEDFEKRLRRVEESCSHQLLDLHHRVDAQDIQLSQVQDLPSLRSDLEELKYTFITDERISSLEKSFKEQVLSVTESLEELANVLHSKDREIAELKAQLHSFGGLEELADLKNQVEELFRQNQQILSHLEPSCSDDTYEGEEELFCRKLGGF